MGYILPQTGYNVDMEIIKVSPRGYCKGVVRAIQIAKDTAKAYPETPIYILGMLVHNTYVKAGLEHLGIITLEGKDREALLDQVDEGIVIFTAHGISDHIRQKAIRKGLHVIDATCPDVKRTQDLVNQHLAKGFEIFYIGKAQHPEAMAVVDGNPNVHLITKQSDVKQLGMYDQIFVTNQTTMSIFEVADIFGAIQEKYPHAIFAEEICNATRIRQEAIAALQDVDTLLIVGDASSNNSKRLADIGKQNNIAHVYLVNDVLDVQKLDLTNSQRIAISSGASTPTYLTNQVIAYLENPNLKVTTIDIDKII